MQNVKLKCNLLVFGGTALLTFVVVNSFHQGRSKVLRADLAALSKVHHQGVLESVWTLAKAYGFKPFPGEIGHKITPKGGSLYGSISIDCSEVGDPTKVEEFKSIIQVDFNDRINDLQVEERSSYKLEYTVKDNGGIIVVDMRTSYSF